MTGGCIPAIPRVSPLKRTVWFDTSKYVIATNDLSKRLNNELSPPLWVLTYASVPVTTTVMANVLVMTILPNSQNYASTTRIHGLKMRWRLRKCRGLDA